MARRALIVEPFLAGSHAAFVRWLTEGVSADWDVLSLPGRHWKWRMRGAAVWFAHAERARLSRPADVLLATSYLPLAELVGLVPALQGVRKVLYFHENQLAFPVRREHVGGPDYHFGFTQLVSALAADRVAFNSAFNRDSFFEGARALLARMPDAVPPEWVESIAAKSRVVPLPLPLVDEAPPIPARPHPDGPLLLWNHRWEHDKDPETFFAALTELAERGVRFRLAVCGERFRKVPKAFEAGHAALEERVVVWGALERPAYEALLREADVCISTARHEFFGVSVLEAMHAGARPVVPDRLAYTETVPSEYRYADGRLVDTLAALCTAYERGDALRADRRGWTQGFSGPRVLPAYESLLFTE